MYIIYPSLWVLFCNVKEPLPHEELLEVSAMMASSNIQSLDVRKFSALGLGAAGLSLRNAADMMLDEDWESAMGELEALRRVWMVCSDGQKTCLEDWAVRCDIFRYWFCDIDVRLLTTHRFDSNQQEDSDDRFADPWNRWQPLPVKAFYRLCTCKD